MRQEGKVLDYNVDPSTDARLNNDVDLEKNMCIKVGSVVGVNLTHHDVAAIKAANGDALPAEVSGQVGMEGCFPLKKANAADVMSFGDKLYQDPTTGNVTKTATGGVVVGVVSEDSAANETHVYTRLAGIPA